MTDNRSNQSTDRSEPVGAPVVRGDPDIVGERAVEATAFDPDDGESLAQATEVVRSFAAGSYRHSELEMLQGAAAAAALVRGEGSYRAAAERAGEGVSVDFLRTWARVHDLPISIRRHIALGDIVPSAAKHIARVTGDARFLLAWSVLDHDLSVRDVRAIASDVIGGTDPERALEANGVTPGRLTVHVPVDTYLRFRREACLEKSPSDEVVARLLDEWLDHRG